MSDTLGCRQRVASTMLGLMGRVLLGGRGARPMLLRF